MKKIKVISFWILAFILTVVFFFYQRFTGPTYPVRGTENIKGNFVKYKFLRSSTAFEKMPVSIVTDRNDLKAFLNYKRFKTSDEWTEIVMRRAADVLSAEIPGQPVAGKIEYSVRIYIDNQNFILNQGKGIVVRFRGRVPSLYVIIHVVLMFLGILFALRTGIEVLRKEGYYFGLVNCTFVIIFLGGMIFGPIVQKYAFGDFWTGFPFGLDLTDNKMLLVFVFWLLAFIFKKKNKWWVLIASILMIVIYLIPHSVVGSELDYKTGKLKNKFSVNFIFSQEDIPNPIFFT
jgi:hypothetical protein